MNDLYSHAVSVALELKNARGTIAKLNIIRNNANNEQFKKLLYYALNPMLSYNISSKRISAILKLCDSVVHCNYVAIDGLCDFLSAKQGLNAADELEVVGFLSGVSVADRNFYAQLLSKELRLGITAKTVNKIIPGLIPEWEVQQAYPIDKYPLQNGTWFALTEKLNGVRATYHRGKLYARSGEEHKGLEHITELLARTVGTAITLDGELTLVDKGGLSDNEAFRVATGIINADIGSADKTKICFTVFDGLPSDEFDQGSSNATYEVRRSILDEIIAPVVVSQCVRILPLIYSGTDPLVIPSYLDQMVAEDKEGLMVNLDVPYLRKRHKGILKVKRFYTMDLPVIGCEEGSGRLAGKLGSLVVDHKGTEVRVGSGFSDEQRVEFWEKRDNLIGALCEVKYKEVSSDKTTGKESLQFPVFVGIRTDKNDVSYG